MDKQTFFDQGVCHVFRQGQPAMHDLITARCAYRNARGHGCFIGGQIPESQYNPRFDDIDYHTRRVLEEAGLSPGGDYEFAAECQHAHDDNARAAGGDFLRRFAKQAGSIAAVHSLDSFALRGCLAALSGAFR